MLSSQERKRELKLFGTSTIPERSRAKFISSLLFLADAHIKWVVRHAWKHYKIYTMILSPPQPVSSHFFCPSNIQLQLALACAFLDQHSHADLVGFFNK